MRHPGQDITSLLLVAGVLAPPFVSHSIHRQSAGRDPRGLEESLHLSGASSDGYYSRKICGYDFAGGEDVSMETVKIL